MRPPPGVDRFSLSEGVPFFFSFFTLTSTPFFPVSNAGSSDNSFFVFGRRSRTTYFFFDILLVQQFFPFCDLSVFSLRECSPSETPDLSASMVGADFLYE